MPNYCLNTVEFEGTPEQIAKIHKAAKTGQLFHALYPMPEELQETVNGSESAKPDWQKVRARFDPVQQEAYDRGVAEKVKKLREKELEAEQTVLLSVVEDLRQNMQIMVSKDTACARARVYCRVQSSRKSGHRV